MRGERELKDELPGDAESTLIVGAEVTRERRRLLRTLASSGALAGLGAPLAAQATSTRPHCKKVGSSHNYHASASAVGSIIGSVAGGQEPHEGYPCSHYKYQSGWTGTSWHNGRGRSLTYNLCANLSWGSKMLFYVAFGYTSPNNAAQNKTEAHWLTALLNANKIPTRFPYTPAHVLDLHRSKHPTLGWNQSGLDAKALQLFTEYLSSKPG
jgi:hypothetical protein